MYLLKNEKALNKMGDNGRVHIEKNYRWERNVEELNKVFNQMIND